MLCTRLGVRVDELAEVAGRRGVQGHAATVPTLVGMATPETRRSTLPRAARAARARGARPGSWPPSSPPWLTGAAAPLDLADPGPLVRWGVPLVSTVSTLAASATVGLLGLAAFLVPERTRTHRRVDGHPVRRDGRHGVGGRRAPRGGADLRRPRRHAADQPRTCSSQLVSFTWTLETTRVLLDQRARRRRRRGVGAGSRPGGRRWPGCAVLTLGGGRHPRAHRVTPPGRRATRMPSTRSACTCSASSCGPAG